VAALAIDDQDESAAAERALEFQRRYDWDFIKIPPSSLTALMTTGRNMSTAPYRLASATRRRTFTERVIQELADWDRIEHLT